MFASASLQFSSSISLFEHLRHNNVDIVDEQCLTQCLLSIGSSSTGLTDETVAVNRSIEHPEKDAQTLSKRDSDVRSIRYILSAIESGVKLRVDFSDRTNQD